MRELEQMLRDVGDQLDATYEDPDPEVTLTPSRLRAAAVSDQPPLVWYAPQGPSGKIGWVHKTLVAAAAIIVVVVTVSLFSGNEEASPVDVVDSPTDLDAPTPSLEAHEPAGDIEAGVEAADASIPAQGHFLDVSLTDTEWCKGLATYSYSWGSVTGRVIVRAWSHADGVRSGPWVSAVSGDGSKSENIEWGSPLSPVPTELQIEFELAEGTQEPIRENMRQDKNLNILDKAWTETISCSS